MSSRATIWAWEQSRRVEQMTSTELLVLLAVADEVNDRDGYWDASKGFYAKKSKLSVRAVFNALQALQGYGLLRLEERGGRPHRVHLLFSAVTIFDDRPTSTSSGRHDVPPSPTPAPRAEGVATGATNPNDTPEEEANASSTVGPDGPTARASGPWDRDEQFALLWAGATDEMRARAKSKANVWSEWKKAVKLMPPERIVKALQRYRLKDADVQRTGGEGLQRWLKHRTFELWDEAEQGAPTWAGPPALWADVVAAKGPEFAASYLAPATVDETGGERRLIPRTHHAKTKLHAETGAIIRSHGFVLDSPALAVTEG